VHARVYQPDEHDRRVHLAVAHGDEPIRLMYHNRCRFVCRSACPRASILLYIVVMAKQLLVCVNFRD
jgi:hypothetical protein